MGAKWYQWQTIFLDSKITVDGDCSHEIKRRLLLGRKAMTNLDSVFKSWDISLPTRVHILKANVFLEVIYSHSSTLAWKIPWTEKPGRLQSMVSLSRTRLSNFTFTFHFDALEKEMATHSSILAWRISGTGGPGRLPSMGSHRGGHDWSDLAAAATAVVLYRFSLRTLWYPSWFLLLLLLHFDAVMAESIGYFLQERFTFVCQR